MVEQDFKEGQESLSKIKSSKNVEEAEEEMKQKAEVELVEQEVVEKAAMVGEAVAEEESEVEE